MNIYDIFMLPLEKRILRNIRKEIIPNAYGQVLEIGYGTGANFPFYDPEKIRCISALDRYTNNPSNQIPGLRVTFLEGSAENLPFGNNAFDTVVETLVFCSVQDLNTAIDEVFRVLKPGGTFIFIDHVLPPNEKLSSLFKATNKIWPKIAGGCNLTRQPHMKVETKGFQIITTGGSGFHIFRWGIVKKPE